MQSLLHNTTKVVYLNKQKQQSMLHQRSRAIFRKIDPAKKFVEFEYYDIKGFQEINGGDINTEMVFKLNSDYFQFFKEEYFLSSDENAQSVIIFKDRAKVIHSQPQ